MRNLGQLSVRGLCRLWLDLVDLDQSCPLDPESADAIYDAFVAHFERACPSIHEWMNDGVVNAWDRAYLESSSWDDLTDAVVWHLALEAAA